MKTFSFCMTLSPSRIRQPPVFSRHARLLEDGCEHRGISRPRHLSSRSVTEAGSDPQIVFALEVAQCLPLIERKGGVPTPQAVESDQSVFRLPKLFCCCDSLGERGCSDGNR